MLLKASKTSPLLHTISVGLGDAGFIPSHPNVLWKGAV